jgi:inositol 1,4,5-triphosphate receptor type 3
MKATPLVFVSSQFHLVHVSSLKFLSLNDDNTESLFYELVDFPSQGSVLRFIPCLQFQKLRTNVIFHGDPVILTSVKTVCNRPP